MEYDITSALRTLKQLYLRKHQKIEEDIKLLLFLSELEQSNFRYYESVEKILLVQGSSFNTSRENRKNIYTSKLSSFNRSRENIKNIYTPKYEWTEDRTQRLLDSIQFHYHKFIKNKDFTKPIWEIVRLDVDPMDSNLKWYTCRHKWSHLEADYNNYIKDLKEYADKSSIPELTLYIPPHCEQIGNILRSGGKLNLVNDQDSAVILQKVLEDKISEVLKTTTWDKLNSGKDDDDQVITVSGVDINVSNVPRHND